MILGQGLLRSESVTSVASDGCGALGATERLSFLVFSTSLGSYLASLLSTFDPGLVPPSALLDDRSVDLGDFSSCRGDLRGGIGAKKTPDVASEGSTREYEVACR